MLVQESTPEFVVGLGASAGGLEALERFFDNCPNDSNGSFVVVMHLARDFKSVLDELLARHTKMAVLPIEDNLTLQPNSVYVIQPGTEVEVHGTQFKVMTRRSNTASSKISSIDILFHSIAATWGKKGAAVVLSGSGSDGAQGVTSIHNAGGIVFAQSPESSKFDSMPISAIATSAVSGVDTPEALAQAVVESVLLPRMFTSRSAGTEQAALQKILNSVVGASHLDASQYTHSTFERRVLRRMKEIHVKSLEDYCDMVIANRDEARSLSETLLIGVTDFFRDEGVFTCLSRQAMPDMIRRATTENRPIRIWVAGCASGEEAYSIAMLLTEVLSDFPAAVEFQIFATDVHKGLLAEAARGEYSSDRMVNVSEERKRAFFSRTASGTWQIDARIRKSIVFAPHDVLVDPPFTRLDLVSCRNLLIYFSIEAQQRVIGSFAFGLHEKGFLLLGASETVGAHRESFEFVDVRRRLFRRTRSITRSPSFVRVVEPYDRIGMGSAHPPARRSLKLRESVLQPAYAAMLREFAPPSLLISSDRELLHTFGDARRFLRAPEGVVRLDITDMCDSALKTPLTAGIDRALRTKTQIVFSHIEINSFPERGLVVDVTIMPLHVESDVTFALVMLKERDPKLSLAILPERTPASVQESQSRTTELEIELLRTREALQATIEEIETANEELQATNEELMSSNEELQSTNEELSSLNEELHSVNAEHFRQNNDLVRLTRDFDALLHATEIGVLFFDEVLNIRRFTRLVVELFQFTESDIGRPLRTFRSPFTDFNLEEFLLRVMRDGMVEEAEVQDQHARTWLLRAAGYPDQKGVVLSIISIARLRDGEMSSLQTRDRLLAYASPFAGDPVLVVEPATAAVLFANRSAWLKLGVPEAPDGGFQISRLTPEWGDSTWTSWLSTINIGGGNSRLDVTFLDKGGQILAVDLVASIANGDDGKPYAVVRIVENRDRARALKELQERARTFAISNRELEQFASVVAHDLRTPLRHLNQFSEFLKTELAETATDTVRSYLDIISESSTNMSSMIEGLLEYARIGAGAPQFANVEIGDCIEQAAAMLKGEIEAKGTTLEVGAMPTVKGDRILLMRLFQNLITNANKYSKPDVKPCIVISSDNDGDTVKIIVSDNGLGIDHSHAEEIFKMFSRLHSESEFAGHGMGLAICRRICDIHGGRISLDTSYQDGAKFIIQLPRLSHINPKKGTSK